MIRLAAAAALSALLLGGCAGREGGPPEEVCARQANDDPAVRALIIKGAGNENFQATSQRQLREAKQDAALNCLRARGLAPKGGVERPKP